MNQEKIGKFISKLRKEKKLTQEELAEKLKVSSKSISRWETGKCMPDISLLIPLSEALDISVNELITGEHIEEKNIKEKTELAIKETINYSNNKLKKEKKKYIWIVIFIIIILSFILGTIDYSRIKTAQNPLFMIRVTSGDRSVHHYIGLGYRASRQIGVSFKQDFKDSNYVKFGPWFYTWQVDILDVKPYTIFALREDNRAAISNIGSYCWYRKDGIYRNGECVDKISPLVMEYSYPLTVKPNEKIKLERFNGIITNVAVYSVPETTTEIIENDYLIEYSLEHKDRQFNAPKEEGEYIFVVDITDKNIDISHSFQIIVEK